MCIIIGLSARKFCMREEYWGKLVPVLPVPKISGLANLSSLAAAVFFAITAVFFCHILIDVVYVVLGRDGKVVRRK
jgi:hypothetical protein